MVGEGPAVENFIGLLQRCRQKKSLEEAKRLHALLCEQELETHPVLGNFLVPMLVDCGSLPDAQQVFNNLSHRNEHSWSSLISAYIECGRIQHAFLLYHNMQDHHHAHPSKYTYLALLRACSILKDADRCRCIHAALTLEGLERDLFVGNTLVNVYSKCALLAEARHVFDMLPVRDAISWNALIAGYADHMLSVEALVCFEQIELEGIAPDDVTFVCTLRACSSTGAVEKGRQLQAEIVKKGLEGDLFVGNALVDMYAKCGHLEEACQVLKELSVRDVVSWNALMAGYAEPGDGEQVLSSFEQMQQEGTSPDDVTFVCSLKACGIAGALEKGTEIHVEIAKRGLEQEIYVANTLVDMYAKCGSLAEASKLVNQLSGQDVVPWTALMAGYVEHGLSDEALNCFEQMQGEGVCPDTNTLVYSLKACSSIGAFERGHLLCAEIVKKGLETDLFVGSAVVDMYAKFGLLADAEKALNQLPARNVVCWTALVAGYAEQGFGEEALNCFKQMHLEGVFPVAVTYACSLKACGIIGALETGREMHSEVTKRGLERELYVGNTLVDMYAKCGFRVEARELFDELPIRNVVAWTALISGYAEDGLDEEVLNCFKQMQLEGVSADAITFVHCLKACGTTGALEIGREIHAEIRKSGLERDLFVGNSLIDMYGKCGSLVEGQEVFDKLLIRDVVSWNAMIMGYGENHEGNMAIECFKDMQEQGVKPDAATFTCLLVACSHASLVLQGQEYFKVMKEEYKIEPTPLHYSCMVDLLARSGHVFEAERFAEVIQCAPSAEILTALLSACKIYGKVELGRRCFEQLV